LLIILAIIDLKGNGMKIGFFERELVGILLFLIFEHEKGLKLSISRKNFIFANSRSRIEDQMTTIASSRANICVAME
jgi:hypothetical protein